jgi:hypothetical protein
MGGGCSAEAGGAATATLAVVEVAASWKPQFAQNLAVVETACPQFGQVRGIA